MRSPPVTSHSHAPRYTDPLRGNTRPGYRVVGHLRRYLYHRKVFSGERSINTSQLRFTRRFRATTSHSPGPSSPSSGGSVSISSGGLLPHRSFASGCQNRFRQGDFVSHGLERRLHIGAAHGPSSLLPFVNHSFDLIRRDLSASCPSIYPIDFLGHVLKVVRWKHGDPLEFVCRVESRSRPHPIDCMNQIQNLLRAAQ